MYKWRKFLHMKLHFIHTDQTQNIFYVYTQVFLWILRYANNAFTCRKNRITICVQSKSGFKEATLLCSSMPPTGQSVKISKYLNVKTTTKHTNNNCWILFIFWVIQLACKQAWYIWILIEWSVCPSTLTRSKRHASPPPPAPTEGHSAQPWAIHSTADQTTYKPIKLTALWLSLTYIYIYILVNHTYYTLIFYLHICIYTKLRYLY